ncbi:hypothetical protein NONO_c35910 [Nocardia nova SH22a]|uniref:DUF8020 domain-containing protein n=1 Tax=Nocardia nova SH22a TaxID=1415166 RepID=W5THD3_9NOCA|nr:hypothetical protein [Nocardia nova]AHH18378.1 hypothetical protein NONO_c35910 [Nocardia nova SH22a]
MKMRVAVGAALIATAAMGVATGTAGAVPAPEAPPGGIATQIIPGVVNYTASNDGNSAVITTDAGSLTVRDGQFQIRAANGEIVGGTPLEVNVDDIVVPIRAVIDGNKATLTPIAEAAFYRPAVSAPKEIAAQTPQEREAAAWSKFTTRVALGSALGALVGTVGSAAVGCVAGGVLGGAVTMPVAMLLGGGPLGGCIAGAVTLAPVGTIGGALLVGVPVAIAGAIEYFSTITAPLPAPAPDAPGGAK